MTKDEALKMALAALEGSIAITMVKIVARNEAIAAIKKTLNQPEQKPIAYSLLSADELAALMRFCETCEDSQPYDVPSSMMQRLSQIGVVRHLSRGIYSITEFGVSVIEARTAPAQPEPVANAFMVELFNFGYKSGNHDTVEGQYIDIVLQDMGTYHSDVVSKWLKETCPAAQLEPFKQIGKPDELSKVTCLLDAALTQNKYLREKAAITTFKPITADDVTDEMMDAYFVDDMPWEELEELFISISKRACANIVNAWGANK